MHSKQFWKSFNIRNNFKIQHWKQLWKSTLKTTFKINIKNNFENQQWKNNFENIIKNNFENHLITLDFSFNFILLWERWASNQHRNSKFKMQCCLSAQRSHSPRYLWTADFPTHFLSFHLFTTTEYCAELESELCLIRFCLLVFASREEEGRAFEKTTKF